MLLWNCCLVSYFLLTLRVKLLLRGRLKSEWDTHKVNNIIAIIRLTQNFPLPISSLFCWFSFTFSIHVIYITYFTNLSGDMELRKWPNFLVSAFLCSWIAMLVLILFSSKTADGSCRAASGWWWLWRWISHHSVPQQILSYPRVPSFHLVANNISSIGLT